MPLDLKKSDPHWLVCKCGNEPHKDGFYPCLPTGEVVEPIIGGEWGGALYVCAKCFAIYDIDTFEQMGESEFRYFPLV